MGRALFVGHEESEAQRPAFDSELHCVLLRAHIDGGAVAVAVTHARTKRHTRAVCVVLAKPYQLQHPMPQLEVQLQCATGEIYIQWGMPELLG